MSRFRLLVLDAPCTERYARCGERTGVNHPLLLDYDEKTEGRKKMDAHVISLANQKGGTAKTTTCANLGI